MKARISLAVMALCILLVLGLAVGCTKSRTDTELTGDVYGKIQSDSNIPSRQQVAVQSANGVVTLSGTVASDAERNAAGVDASQVPGVKTVVNNLTTGANAAAQPVTPPVVQEQPAAQPEPRQEKSSARHERVRPGDRGTRDRDSIPATSTQVAQNQAPVNTYTPPPAPATPPPPPPIQRVTVPDGTTMAVRLIDGLDSEKNQVGDTFRASIAHPIAINENVVIPQGADVEGRVIDVKDAGHFKGQSVLAVELVALHMNGKNYDLRTQEFRREGTARGKNTAEKIGGGAALGALIGGLAGGGKGAAIGATVGAGAGTGVQAATKGQQIRLPSETVLNFTLAAPVTVIPQGKLDRNRGFDNNGPDNPDRPKLERRNNGDNPGDNPGL